MYQPGGKLPPEGRGMKWVEMALELSSKNVGGGGGGVINSLKCGNLGNDPKKGWEPLP